jgi:DNA-binding NarL/FixJ family response regulator
MNPSPSPRFLIADDHQVVRRGLRQLLEDGYPDCQCREATNGAEALQAVYEGDWDLVVLDVNMPGRSGIDVLAEIKKVKPGLPVLILSMYSESEYAIRALKAGASGYVQKSAVTVEMLDAVSKALGGGRYITPSLAELLASSIGLDADKKPHESLSEREFEVMQLIANGKSVKEISRILSLSEKTVFTYRSRLLAKLGLSGDVDIARYAIRHGIVD